MPGLEYLNTWEAMCLCAYLQCTNHYISPHQLYFGVFYSQIPNNLQPCNLCARRPKSSTWHWLERDVLIPLLTCTQTHKSLLLLWVQVDTHLAALSPPSFGGLWSSASCLCPAGPAKNSPPLGQSLHSEASPKTHSVSLTRTDWNSGGSVALSFRDGGSPRHATMSEQTNKQKCSPLRGRLRSKVDKTPAGAQVHSAQISCSSVQADGEPSTTDPVKQKLVQNLSGHAPQVHQNPIQWPQKSQKCSCVNI